MKSTTRLDRRKFLKTAVVGGLGLSLAACGGPANPTAAPPAQATEVPVVKATEVPAVKATEVPAVVTQQEMNVIGWGGDIWGKIGDKFKAETGIKVNYDVFPAKWDDTMQKFTLWGQSGYSGIDVMAADDLIGAIYAGNGWADELSGLDGWTKYKDDWVDGINTLNTAVKGIFRVFYFLGVETFFYNKDLVPTPPKTWDEMVTFGQKAVNADKDIWGWRPLIGEGHGFNTVALMLHHSGANLDTLDDPATLVALQFIADWVFKYKITPKSAIEEGWNLVLSLAAQGKAGMWWGYEGMYSTELATEKTTLTPQNLSYARWPMGPKSDYCLLHGWGWMVPKASKKKDLSKTFINWISQPENLKIITLDHNTPPRKSFFKDPDVVKANPVLTAGIGWDELIRGGRFREPVVTTPQCSQMYTMFDNASRYLVAGDKNPQEVWDYMKKELATIKSGT